MVKDVRCSRMVRFCGIHCSSPRIFLSVFLSSSLFHNEYAVGSVFKDAHSLLDEALLPVTGEGKDLSHTLCPGVAPYQSSGPMD